MDRDESKRTEIEDRIISKASDIELQTPSEEGVGVDLDKLDEFMDECRELVHYYRDYTDTVIGVEVVRVYSDFTRYFRILRSSANDPKIRESAQDWLDELENWIDKIITEAAKNWEHLHSDA